MIWRRYEPLWGWRTGRIVMALGAVFAILTLRLVDLGSDPYQRLDWDTGILTDEAFYSLNARNLVLFGQARLDEFNNMLVSPLVHWAQVGVFRALGVGFVPARLISVACSLAAVLVLFSALRRAFDLRIAWTGALLLGLDHTAVLFHRLALLDVPASLGAVAAFYAFVRGTTSHQEEIRAPHHPPAEAAPLDTKAIPPHPPTPPDNKVRGGGLRVPVAATSVAGSTAVTSVAGSTAATSVARQTAATSVASSSVGAGAWLLLCGLLLAATVANRSLCLYLIPAPFFAAWPNRRQRLAVAAGLSAGIAVYLALWYFPNRAELAHMNHYFRTAQIQPDSWPRLAYNVRIALLGERFGFSSFLFRHTPAAFALALAGIAACLLDSRRRTHLPLSAGRAAEKYLCTWVVCALAVLAISSYAPDRYLISVLPALFGIAAVAFWRLPVIMRRLAGISAAARVARGALAWLLTYHAVEAVIHRDALLPGQWTTMALLSVPSLICLLAVRTVQVPLLATALRFRAAAAAVWIAVNLAWTASWFMNRTYTQRDTARWLRDTLPPNAVLLGDVAPGLAMDTGLRAVNVMEGLCNDRDPFVVSKGAPVFIALLDGPRFKGPYWVRRYSRLVNPARRLRRFTIIKWPIGIYPGPPGPPAKKL